LKTIEVTEARYFHDSQGDLLLVGRTAQTPVNVIRLPSWNEEATPFVFRGSSLPLLSDDQKEFYETSTKSVAGKESNCTCGNLTTVGIWSIAGTMREIKDIPTGSEHYFRLFSTESRLLAACHAGEKIVPCLWDSEKGGLIANLVGAVGYFDESVSTKRKLVVTSDRSESGDIVSIHLWSLDSGKFLNQNLELNVKGRPANRRRNVFVGGGIRFTRDGSLLLVGGAETEPSPLTVLETANLTVYQGLKVPQEGAWLVDTLDGTIAFWNDENDDAKDFNLDSNLTFVLRKFGISSVSVILPIEKTKNLIALRENGQVES
jgi:hypothetical protein